MAHMNPRNHSLLIFCLAFVLFCNTQAAHAQTNYCSNGIHFPLIQENIKGTISAGYIFTERVNGFSIQTAYNPWKKLIVTGNFWGASKNTGNESYRFKYNRQLEVGLGAYENTEKLQMSALIGGGLGRIACQQIDRLDYDTKFNRLFLQGSFTYTNTNFYIGTALRFNYLNFYKADVSLQYKYSSDARLLESNNPSFQPEIGFLIGTMGKNIFLDFAINYFHRPVQNLSINRVIFRVAMGCFLNSNKPNVAKKKKK